VHLPQREPVVVARGEIAGVERDREEHHPHDLPLRQEPLGDAALIEQLDRARLQAARAQPGERLALAPLDDRDIDPGERELIHKLGIRFITMRDIDERGMSACIDEAIHIASAANAGYSVTFDVDALDPGDAPGSGTLVRGGLTYREAHLAMEKIAEAGGMRSLEVVGINTALDVNNKTAELGVELILSALGKTIL